MGSSIAFLLFLQIILIALNAIFASAEIAVLSISEAKLEHLSEAGNHRAKRLFRLTSEPAKFLATIQVAITLSGFLGSAFAADNFSEPLVNWVLSIGIQFPRDTLDTIAVILITLVLSYFTLVFGELVPKRLAMQKSEQIAMRISGLVSGISVIFKPIVWFLSISTNLILRLCGVDPMQAEDDVSEEEIRMLVDAGTKKGTIDHHEKELIQNVFEFNDTDARSIATHRTDISFLWLQDDEIHWAQIIHDGRHSRYPVCDGSPDNIIGILNVYDYFRLSDKRKTSILENAVHPAYFVPDTVKADILFRNMKQNHHALAVVIDEYGGMVGVVTLYDLIEELVGTLQDAAGCDHHVPYVEQIDDSVWKVTGNISLRELEEATGLPFPSDDYGTFTGLVFDALGRIPENGTQRIDLTLNGIQIYIDRVDAHQIEEAIIQTDLSKPRF